MPTALQKTIYIIFHRDFQLFFLHFKYKYCFFYIKVCDYIPKQLIISKSHIFRPLESENRAFCGVKRRGFSFTDERMLLPFASKAEEEWSEEEHVQERDEWVLHKHRNLIFKSSRAIFSWSQT